MSESAVMKEIMLAAPAMGARLLRNNTGTLQDTRGGFVHYGVGGNGGADLIGWCDVGGHAIFIAVEVKRSDWREPKSGKEFERWERQKRFIDAVANAGGISCLARSVEDVKQAIQAYRLKTI